MSNKNDNINIKETWKHTKRGFGIIRKLNPYYTPFTIFNAVINALQPFITLYFTAQILNELAGARNVRAIITYAILTTILTFLLSVVRLFVSRKIAIIETAFHTKLYFFHSERYMNFDFEHVEKNKTNERLADIEAKINGNGLGIPKLYWEFPGFVQSLFGIITSCVLLIGMFRVTEAYTTNFFTSPYATFALCVLIILSMFLSYSLRQKEQIVLKKIFERNPKTNSFFHYYFQYVQAGEAGKDIRIYNQKSAIMDIAKSWISTTPWHDYFSFEGKLNGITSAVNALIGGCVYLFIGLRALSGMYGIGSVVQYVGAVTSLVNNLSGFLNSFASFRTNSQYLALLYEYLDLPDEKYKGTLTTEKRADNEYEIEFLGVSFRYPDTKTYALKNLSLKFRAGERLAVVGMNGSGKTTMIKLLCRLYEPTEGSITLNGIDINKYDYNEYMNIFSVVFQDFRLFSLPLTQNVAASTEIDNLKVEACLQKAGFTKRLQDMPKGLDTCLYKDFDKAGIEISGGEAQKIALARALYKDAPFIVLDEPTAALDPIAEFEIYSKFNEIIGDKTAIYISHRLSSCRFCDDIAVFHEGELIQRGSHDELIIDSNGKYYGLWNAQAQYYTEKEAVSA